jgi:hypothetical protein
VARAGKPFASIAATTMSPTARGSRTLSDGEAGNGKPSIVPTGWRAFPVIACVVSDSREHHPCTRVQQGLSHAQADSAGGARDKRGASLDPVHIRPSLIFGSADGRRAGPERSAIESNTWPPRLTARRFLSGSAVQVRKE